MKFLVVDDSSMDRYLTVSLLNRMGHTAEQRETTFDLIKQLKQKKYTAIILDIVMPNQNGYEFLRELRSNSDTANQYVIFCSNKKTTLEINYGIKQGANDYLTKPVSQKTLAQAIQKIHTNEE